VNAFLVRGEASFHLIGYKNKQYWTPYNHNTLKSDFDVHGRQHRGALAPL